MSAERRLGYKLHDEDCWTAEPRSYANADQDACAKPNVQRPDHVQGRVTPIYGQRTYADAPSSQSGDGQKTKPADGDDHTKKPSDQSDIWSSITNWFKDIPDRAPVKEWTHVFHLNPKTDQTEIDDLKVWMYTILVIFLGALCIYLFRKFRSQNAEAPALAPDASLGS